MKFTDVGNILQYCHGKKVLCISLNGLPRRLASGYVNDGYQHITCRRLCAENLLISLLFLVSFAWNSYKFFPASCAQDMYARKRNLNFFVGNWCEKLWFWGHFQRKNNIYSNEWTCQQLLCRDRNIENWLFLSICVENMQFWQREWVKRTSFFKTGLDASCHWQRRSHDRLTRFFSDRNSEENDEGDNRRK